MELRIESRELSIRLGIKASQKEEPKEKKSGWREEKTLKITGLRMKRIKYRRIKRIWRIIY